MQPPPSGRRRHGMARLGCIDIPRLPLQILLRKNPGWRGMPVAVTKEEKPLSPILSLSRAARDRGLAVGMRYAEALSLVPGLRAGAVSKEKIEAARGDIVKLLSTFTPDIEPCPFDPDAIWVSVEGLRSLFASPSRWILAVRQALQAAGYKAHAVIGFSRFGTYAIARGKSRSRVLATRQAEQLEASGSSIAVLPLSVKTRSALTRLGIRTVRDFISLPDGGSIRRFGKEVAFLRQLILADRVLPIQPVAIPEDIPFSRHLEFPIVDLELLMPHIEELVASEVARADKERTVIAELTLTLRMEEGELATEVIRPATPTLTTSILRRLIHLRLSRLSFSSGIGDIEIRSARVRPSHRQEDLFDLRRRDLDSGARAFALICARFGNNSVTSARLCDSYLPERSFTWVPLQRPQAPSGSREIEGPARAVRRILCAPMQMPPGRPTLGAMAGPFVVSGEWWGDEGEKGPFLRDYYFQGTDAGCLWLFVDRHTNACWMQGVVD